MDITTLAAWGEFLGGIAVVVSLIYLASQIRQNSKLLRSSTASVNGDALTRNLILIAQNPELAGIFHGGLGDRDSLSEVDKQRFDALLAIQLNGVQQHFRLARDGSIGPETWADMDQLMRWSTIRPGFRQYWLQWGEQTHRGDFRDYIDGLIREGEAAG
ncbi:MAG: hypothetical protein JRF61_04960 [Deltaproteobacteria bacterium]|jgi:hypothetical protein|nr:hypothetical protein [Deltaproteobacteria bacterium]